MLTYRAEPARWQIEGSQPFRSKPEQPSLFHTYLSKANLSKANLHGAEPFDVLLIDADFSGADLSDTILISADLTGANLAEAKLSGARYSMKTIWPAHSNLHPMRSRWKNPVTQTTRERIIVTTIRCFKAACLRNNLGCWRLQVTANTGRPLYIVHTHADTRIDIGQSEQLAAAAQAAGVKVMIGFRRTANTSRHRRPTRRSSCSGWWNSSGRTWALVMGVR